MYVLDIADNALYLLVRRDKQNYWPTLSTEISMQFDTFTYIKKIDDTC